ncbi:malate permease [Williamsoniiplasma somnilux]|uniref:Malate permease n=1 Tax=Williamsoniiplasma somnilux TaxID=215578 RepID=A0A2K8NZE6_9MOLU|nr:AEC family transporter [Williamsoniiplasma somnilux]ATZ18926.1 malate permease [Williamsoniiplasma somnilux]
MSNVLILSEATDAIKTALSSLIFWGSIIAACFVIFLGFIIQRKKIANDGWEKPLVKVLLMIGLPALILKSFMVDLSKDNALEMFMIMLVGLLFFFALAVFSKYFYIKNSRSIQDTLSMCVAFGSTVYFGVPIALSITPESLTKTVEASANMFNVGFWIFMCSWALFVIKRPLPGTSLDGKNLKGKENDLVNIEHRSNKIKWLDIKGVILTPIIISLIVGIVLWILQLIPGIDVIHVTDGGWNTIKPGYYSITRIDALIPGVDKILIVLSALPTPLAWLAVGALIGKSDINAAIKNKTVWYTFALKNVFAGLFGIAVVSAIAAIGNATGSFEISKYAFVMIVLSAASPIATTIVSYSIMYNKEPVLASEATTLSTVGSVVSMPLWTIIALFVGFSSPIFA